MVQRQKVKDSWDYLDNNLNEGTVWAVRRVAEMGHHWSRGAWSSPTSHCGIEHSGFLQIRARCHCRSVNSCTSRRGFHCGIFVWPGGCGFHDSDFYYPNAYTCGSPEVGESCGTWYCVLKPMDRDACHHWWV